jgi:hypothetical protein
VSATAPADAIFDTAIEVIKTGFPALTPAERADRIKRIVDACREVASASGGLGKLLGLGTGVSSEEESILDAMAGADDVPLSSARHGPAQSKGICLLELVVQCHW